MTRNLHYRLEKWLEASAVSLAAQGDKLALFEKEAIYLEYWIQNEMAACLPWKESGRFLIDRGPGLVIPGDTIRYPDFILRFGDNPEEPVFFLELKDLITNTQRNVDKLIGAIENISQVNRENTIDRWQSSKSLGGAAAVFGAEIESAPFIFGGLAVGRPEHIPSKIDHGEIFTWPISEQWQLALLLVVDQKGAQTEPDQSDSAMDPLETVDEKFASANLDPYEIALQTAILNELTKGKLGRGVEIRLESKQEAERFRDEIMEFIRDYNQVAKAPIQHASAWVWTPQSLGQPLTNNGQENEVELRFQYMKKGNRIY